MAPDAEPRPKRPFLGDSAGALLLFGLGLLTVGIVTFFAPVASGVRLRNAEAAAEFGQLVVLWALAFFVAAAVSRRGQVFDEAGGPAARSVLGKLANGTTALQRVLFSHDVVRLSPEAEGLVVARRTAMGRAAMAAWLWTMPFQLVALGLDIPPRPWVLVAVGVPLGILAVFDPPAIRRRTVIAWRDIRVAVEREDGVDLHFFAEDRPSVLEVRLDPPFRERLAGMVAANARVVPLAAPPAEKPIPPLGEGTVRELDRALDRLPRL